MNDELATWLNEQLQRRNWSIREAARQIGVSHTSISDLINGQMNASPEMCNRLARVFDVPAVDLFRRAGLLPPETGNEEPSLREALHLFRELPPERRKTILIAMRALLEEERRTAEAVGKRAEVTT